MKKLLFTAAVFLLLPKMGAAQSTQFYLEDKLAGDAKVRIYVVADVQAQNQVAASMYQAVDHARGAWKKLDGSNSGSEVGRINAQKRGGNFRVGPELTHAIASGLDVARLTRGAFDLTTDSTESTFNKVKINKSNGALTLKSDNIALNLKDLLYGVLTDIIADDLVRAGWRNCLVKIETVFVSRGNDANGPWKIPVMTPSDRLASRVLFYKAKQDLSAATFPMKNAVSVVDPRTRQIAATDLRSATIFARSGAEANALAQALYVMGLNDAKSFLARNKKFRAVLNTTSGEMIHVPALGDRVSGLEDESAREEIVSTPTFAAPAKTSSPIFESAPASKSKDSAAPTPAPVEETPAEDEIPSKRHDTSHAL